MKNRLLIVASVALVFAFFFCYGLPKQDEVKHNTEQIAVSTSAISLELKEAYKVDDAEYKSAVATPFSTPNQGGSLVGIAILLSFLGLVLRFQLQLRNFFSRFSFVNPGFATAGVGPFLKFDKTGLEGDNLKFVNDLEKRIKGISDDEIKDLLKADLKLAVREAMEQFKRFEQLDEANVAKMKEMLGEDEKGIRSILLKQGEAITKLKGNLDNAEEHLNLRSQVAKWQADNKEDISKLRSGEKVSLKPFEVRAAASPMTPANTLNDTITINPAAAIRGGAQVFDVRRVEPTFWDYIPKGRTGLETLPWVNKKVAADLGAAGFIGPGVAKPGVSFTFEVEKSNAVKVAVSMKLATELLEDIDGMTTYVQGELAYQLKSKVNTTLMTGVASATVPAGVQTFSLGFTTSGLSTVNPNNWDCARAVVAQMRKAFINGPIVIFMNPIDTANMDMEKAVSQGTYMGLNVRQVPGAVIVEDYNVAAGYLQAISLDCLKTLIYKDFVLKFGWENDDFTKNLVTAIAEMRFHSFHSENDAAGFVYDDFADIKSQIAAA